VLPFPVREKTTRLAIHGTPSQPMVFAVWRCAGGCEAFVSSPHAYCLACAVREESAND
jgi:hypothetical protein